MKQLPRRVPMRIVYRKANRQATSLCYVLAQESGVIWCAGSLDGDNPLGLVTINEDAVVHSARLVEVDE